MADSGYHIPCVQNPVAESTVCWGTWTRLGRLNRGAESDLEAMVPSFEKRACDGTRFALEPMVLPCSFGMGVVQPVESLDFVGEARCFEG